VESKSAISPNEARIGLFWFIAEDRKASRFASISRPFSEVSEIGGFKTLDEGHVDVLIKPSWTTSTITFHAAA
jgi:hypothetical protein